MRLQKPVIVVGDFSMVYANEDVADVKNSRGQTGFTDADIEDFHYLLQTGLLDAFRLCHPQVTDQYTWWPQIIKTSKEDNLGWRADYWLTIGFGIGSTILVLWILAHGVTTHRLL